eukprot:maker-scaffold60_size442463-snap-gene-0.21 protein:Tk12062 transcript:maker-scaffold60_size442463-snap-gene-0.21-mRNA-1 annotation:"something about silencing protein 10"
MSRRPRSGRKAAGHIALQPDVGDSDEGRDLGRAVVDPMEAAEAEEERDLRRSLARGGRRAPNRRHADLVLDISDSDSDSDLALPVGRAPAASQDSDLDEAEAEAAHEHQPGGEGWVSRKQYFYGGNPNQSSRRGPALADDELSEAEMEAIESRQLQERQLAVMDEADFLDTFAPTHAPSTQKKSAVQEGGAESIQVDLSKLTKKEKAKVFAEESPEFAGILADFDDKLAEAQEILGPIVTLINEGRIPPGPVAQFVQTRYRLILNYCTNIGCYIGFKAQKVPLKYHPLTGRLVQYKQLLDRSEAVKESVMPQMLEILDKLEKGETIESLVKKARRKAKMSERKQESKPKKRLRILEPAEKPKAPKENGGQTDLTMDERMALEMYDAMRGKNKANMEEDSESDLEEEEGEKGEELIQAEDVNGEDRRSITYQMAKNKGLTPKRSKLQRNPRVKNRKKFDKAQVRRKGQVRAVRTEVQKYAGEHSGINARVKKGVKLA